MNPKNKINGFLVVDKPYEMGSTQVVSLLKRYFHPEKIGHAGTLDPLASGVLPIALGKATRLISYVMEGHKTYRFTIQWGMETASDDLGGDVVDHSEVRPSKEAVEAVLGRFKGQIMQTPNIFSALRVNGQRAYDLARQGKEVHLAARPVFIYSLKLIDFQPEEASFEVVCSKGTYVRSLAHDIAHALGTVGVVTFLRRTVCLPFDLSMAVTVEQIKSGEVLLDNLPLIPMEKVLPPMPCLFLSTDELYRLSCGQRLSMNKLSLPQEITLSTGVAKVQTDGVVCGLVQKDNLVLRPLFIW